MIRILTSNGTFDYVKESMIPHFISTGYLVAPAFMLDLYTKKEALLRQHHARRNK